LGLLSRRSQTTPRDLSQPTTPTSLLIDRSVFAQVDGTWVLFYTLLGNLALVLSPKNELRYHPVTLLAQGSALADSGGKFGDIEFGPLLT
jgi:hypothetical protein